jgi:indole-3-glycerol phosphate synthase
MSILQKIVLRKKQEIIANKERNPIAKLEKRPFFYLNPKSLVAYLHKPDKTGIIAEFKRQSPSKGVINAAIRPEQMVKWYENAGASAVSVLTDQDFFGGNENDLLVARQTVDLPILRKDFIIDEYQILEAKSIGADIILLIAAILEPKEIKALTAVAKNLGLSVLLEVHDQLELEKSLFLGLDAVGVNNRNLNTFEVSVQTSLDLVSHIPNEFAKVAESGIDNVDTIKTLRQAGYKGFLIGEHFMKQENPEMVISDFFGRVKDKI